jgi:hypothetical protein
MQSKQYRPAHPIVFVMDFASDAVEIPEYEPGKVTANNSTCVSVRTIADVDGEVTVFLADGSPSDPKDLGTLVFVGEIQVSSETIALVTSENEKLLEHRIGKKTADLRIFVDDEEYPAKIWVFAQ